MKIAESSYSCKKSNKNNTIYMYIWRGGEGGGLDIYFAVIMICFYIAKTETCRYYIGYCVSKNKFLIK